jgi:hypothetical protein
MQQHLDQIGDLADPGGGGLICSEDFCIRTGGFRVDGAVSNCAICENIEPSSAMTRGTTRTMRKTRTTRKASAGGLRPTCPRRGARSVLLGLLLVTGACRPLAPPPDAFSHLRARILYEGQPAAATLTVAGGAFHQRWENVTAVDARVPSRATYIIDAKAPGDTSVLPVTFRDLVPELRIAPGDTLDILIHLLRPGLPRPFDPVVLIEQAGAEAVVSNRVELDRARPGWRRLVSTIEADSGAFVLLDGIYRDPDVSPDSMRAFTCGSDCPHLFLEVDCSIYCYACSTTAVYVGYWKANYNMCSFTTLPGRAPASEFEELRANTGGVNLAAALRREAAVLPLRAELIGPGDERQMLASPLRSRSYPDFVVPTGSYRYAVTVPAARGSQPERYEFPVSVSDGRITEMLVQLPADDLTDLEPVVLADTRLGIAVRQVESSREAGSLEVRVSTVDPDAGTAWILVQLPEAAALHEVVDLATGAPKLDGVDYVTAQRAGRTTITVRTEGARDAFAIRWE